jgi:2-hydroxychromene-2-carboxylate isomerase
VQAALEEAGLPGADLVARAGEPGVKEELRRRTDEAVARGVFGAPSFFVEGALYWGQDRLAMVEKAIRGWIPPEARP